MTIAFTLLYFGLEVTGGQPLQKDTAITRAVFCFVLLALLVAVHIKVISRMFRTLFFVVFTLTLGAEFLVLAPISGFYDYYIP